MNQEANLTDPHNPEVEGALLGAILADNRAYDHVADFLYHEHFYEPVHGRIFQAIAKRIEKGVKVTPSVLMEFADDPDLKEQGGQQYVYELAASVISISSVRDHGEIIRDLYMRREIILACRNAIADASEYDIDNTAKQVIEGHEELIYDITKTPTQTSMVDAGAAFTELLIRTEAAMKRDTPIAGVPMGIAALDGALGGMQKSDLIVIGARPSMGKTSLAVNIIWNAASEGYACALFTMEMPHHQIAGRFGAKETGLDVSKIHRGDLTMDEWRQLETVQREIASNLRLHIDDSGKISVPQIRSRVRRLMRKGLDLVVIDYLGLIEPSQLSRRNNRTEQVSEITRELKQMAKDFDIPIVLLAQLNRDLERRDNKRPMLADLRESGSIEQDADSVMFLYRDAYYLEKNEPTQGGVPNDTEMKYAERHATWLAAMTEAAGVCEAIIAKNRQGPCMTVKMFFDGATNRMTDIEMHPANQMDMELQG